MPNDLVSTREACVSAGVPYYTLNYWIRRGYVQAVKRGYFTLVSLSSVRAFKANGHPIVPWTPNKSSRATA